jgi:hypothetical protein
MSKLSLSLHKYDVTTAELIGEIKIGLDKTHPILGQIQVYSVVHGGTTRQVTEPQIVETEMRQHSTDAVIHFDSFLKTDVERFIELLYNMWEAFASQATKALFETVSLTTEAVGNVHNAAGKNIWETHLEMLESLEMHFDEDGNHNYKYYTHPDTAKKLAENPPTPEQEKRAEEIIKRKREEYYAKKRTRRLS